MRTGTRDTGRFDDPGGARPQPWRIVVFAAVAASHVGLVVVLSRPVANRPQPMQVDPVERIQLVEVAAAPAPPPHVRPPRRTSLERATSGILPPAPARQRAGEVSSEVHETDRADPPSDASAGIGPPVAAQPSFAPPASGRSLRNPVQARLPGREDAIVDGFHVREQPSIQDRVVSISARLFGAGQPETCDDVRQRLIGAGPGLARDMDIERMQRLCTN